jgi:NAD(P)H-dependent FMN reductase
MSSTALRLALIVGSTRDGRFGPVVANWFAEQARQYPELAVDVVDLARAALPTVLPAFGGTIDPADAQAVRAVSTVLDTADAFVIVTPEYNHSFPAALKNAIDWHNTQWHAKPIGFVSYGGIAGGLRAVEHLRQVFAELHAMTIRDTVSFHAAWEQFNADGQPKNAAGCTKATKTMLDQLIWWARALRDARAAHPYRV